MLLHSHPVRLSKDTLRLSLIRRTVYVASLKNMSLPLRLAVENEVYRLTVWRNPANDAKRGMDHISTAEKTMLDVSSYLRSTR